MLKEILAAGTIALVGAAVLYPRPNALDKISVAAQSLTDVRSSDNLEIACNPPARPQEELRQIKYEMVKAAGFRSGRGFELDHRIPRCLGGSDEVVNLWLQRCDSWAGYRCASGPAAIKDVAEAEWCRRVCDEHSANLADAQQFFRTWKDAE